MERMWLSAWQLRRHGAVLAWLLLLAWQSLATQLLLPRPASMAGITDAVALWGLGAMVVAALLATARPVRLPLLCALGVALAVLNLANIMFLSFFDTYVNIETWRTLDQAAGAASGIRRQVTPRLLMLHVAIPMLLLVAALWASRTRTRKLPGAAWVLMAAGVMAAVAHPALAARRMMVGQHHPVMHLARQAFHRLASRMFTHDARAREEIRRDLAALGVPPPQDGWSSFQSDRFPLLRVPDQPVAPVHKHNVVIILMESFRVFESGLIPGAVAEGVAPHLKELAAESLFFPHFYANAHQTVRGELATLCSVLPNYTGGQVYSRQPDLRAVCLPEVLRNAGWETHWISTYTARYGNKRGFLSRHGVDRFHDDPREGGVPLKRAIMGWGPSDEDLADYAIRVLDAAHAPFFAEVMTLTNHYPFNGPYPIADPPAVQHSTERLVYKNYLRGMHYTDHAVNLFMEQARTRPWFKDTVFLILGDHGVYTFPERYNPALTGVQRTEVYFRVPFLIYAPGLVAPAVSTVVASQVDVMPTVFDLLGIKVAHAAVGTSLLRTDVPPPERLAVVGNENTWHVRRGARACYVADQQCFRFQVPSCPKGYEPPPSGLTCFEHSGDVLDLRPGATRITPLSESDAAPIMDRGDRLVEALEFLLPRDALYPREPNSADLGATPAEPGQDSPPASPAPRGG